jgi:hypothetical protein
LTGASAFLETLHVLLSGVEFRGEFGFVTAPPWFGLQEWAHGIFGGHALPNCGAYDAP